MKVMFEEAKKLIENSSKIYIVGHKNPDGDSIGSAFSMCLALRKLNKNANVIISKYSDSFSFLPYINEEPSFVKENKFDLLICVDSSDSTRFDISKEDFDKAKNILMLDHHKKVAPYGNINIIRDDFPATCELIYDFLEFLNVEMDKEIASFIYMGIMTDTGSFNYSSTRPSTLRIAANLVDTGINFSYICDKLNHTMKEAKLKLLAKTIENMEVYFDGKLRYSYIPYSIILSLGLDEEDAEGMTNYLRLPEKTEVAVYIRGKSDGTYKVSLRSGGNVDVSKIAIGFGGGGHMRAAGYTITNDLEQEKKQLIDIIGGKF